EVVFNGTPVDIPVEYLDTLEFRGPEHFKGKVALKVQAYTVDTDEDADDNTQNTAVSGEAWLTLDIAIPVPDQVTLKVEPAIGFEDTPVTLKILPTSDDLSETFNVTISKIPEGAELIYGGQRITSTGPVD